MLVMKSAQFWIISAVLNLLYLVLSATNLLAVIRNALNGLKQISPTLMCAIL